jgi:endonuclease YncB( thermonuclease family)
MLAGLFALAVLASNVQVVAGDVVVANGQPYRLYRVDAPQTGVFARCANEVNQAQALAAHVRDLVAAARVVEVRPAFDPQGRRSWPHDRAGRRLGYVTLDGRDLGQMLIAEQRATPWDSHQKHDWCSSPPYAAEMRPRPNPTLELEGAP